MATDTSYTKNGYNKWLQRYTIKNGCNKCLRRCDDANVDVAVNVVIAFFDAIHCNIRPFIPFAITHFLHLPLILFLLVPFVLVSLELVGLWAWLQTHNK